MRHLYWTLFTLWLLRMPTFGQLDPDTVLHDALVLENRGSFETAAKVTSACSPRREGVQPIVSMVDRVLSSGWAYGWNPW
jgi:hypothetical protein